MVFERSPSTSRHDVPRRPTPQERPRTLTAEEVNGLPRGTPSATCACGNCWPGVPLLEDDPFAAKCGCVNRTRVAVHPYLTVRFPGGERKLWEESGNQKVYQYQGDGIWKTRLFDGPPCNEPVEGEEYIPLKDELKYYYKLSFPNIDTDPLATPIVTLEFDGDPESANCPIIEATWCFADACGLKCLCPWIFKTTMPFEWAEVPDDCNLCVTPVRRLRYQICTDSCQTTPFMAITIPNFGFGTSSQIGHEGEMEVLLSGYLGQEEWPDEIELPQCVLDTDGETDIVSLEDTNTKGYAARVLIPFQDVDAPLTRYAAWLTNDNCPSGDLAQIRVSLSCGFNEGGDRIVEVIVLINFWYRVKDGALGSQNGCRIARYDGEFLITDYCNQEPQELLRETDFTASPSYACGDDNLIEGDAKVPDRIYIQAYDPLPPNTSGQNAENCGGEVNAPDCAIEACVLKATNLGEGLGKRWVLDAESTTCDACGSCYPTGCSGTQDSVCGEAADYPDDYKCFKRCESGDPPTEDTVTVTFDYDGSGGCGCGETTTELCLGGEGLYEGVVTLCGSLFTFSYYEDGGTWHLDGGPINASSASPSGPFVVAGPSDLPGCDGLNNVTVS